MKNNMKKLSLGTCTEKFSRDLHISDSVKSSNTFLIKVLFPSFSLTLVGYILKVRGFKNHWLSFLDKGFSMTHSNFHGNTLTVG